jgi:hypothetical protein
MTMVRRCTALLAAALAACAQMPPAASTAAAPDEAPARRPDEQVAETPIMVDLFGHPVRVGLSDEIVHERRFDFDLDGAREAGRSVLSQELKVDASWRPFANTTAFVQGLGLVEQRTLLRDHRSETRHWWERGQTWLLAEGIAGQALSIQVGRIALIEPRSWWWDDDLDAVRLRYAPGDWDIETGLAHEVAKLASTDDGIRAEARGVTRWFGRARWRWAERQTLEAFWLAARDASGAPAPGTPVAPDAEDRSDANLQWIGLRAEGEWRNASRHRLRLRADAAWLQGHDARTALTESADGASVAGASVTRRVRAHAFDLGAWWIFPGDARATLAIGYAQGSGGSADASLDRNFRQTGLQENKGRIGGVKRMRYYGELLDPELSNLRIATLGFGVRGLQRSSIEVLLHDYRQVVASTEVTGSRLSVAPLGTDARLGRELDLQLAVREWQHFELIARFGLFRPGPAFADDRRATARSVELAATVTF